MKTWGYLIAIESEEQIRPEHINNILAEMVESGEVSSTEVTSMGQIDLYPETKTDTSYEDI